MHLWMYLGAVNDSFRSQMCNSDISMTGVVLVLFKLKSDRLIFPLSTAPLRPEQ